MGLMTVMTALRRRKIRKQMCCDDPNAPDVDLCMSSIHGVRQASPCENHVHHWSKPTKINDIIMKQTSTTAS